MCVCVCVCVCVCITESFCCMKGNKVKVNYGLCSPWHSPGQNTGVGSPFSRGSSEPRSPALQVDFFTS